MARTGLEITPPFFEIGPKAYMYGVDLIDLARRADALGRAQHVQVIITPQAVDIPLVVRAVETALVFAQHMDSLERGRGVGSVLPEAVKAAGATGVLLNHVERRLSRDELARTMRRADEVGLATMVCADDAQDAAAIAGLGPNVIIVEEPLLIAGGRRDDGGQAGDRGGERVDLAREPGDPRAPRGGHHGSPRRLRRHRGRRPGDGLEQRDLHRRQPAGDARGDDPSRARGLGSDALRRESMAVSHASFTVQSDRRPTFDDVTARVEGALATSGIRNGILLVYSQHTTCSVLIQEASDDVDYWGTELLMQDLVTVLEGLVPTCRTEGQYRHPGPKHIVAAAGRDELPSWSLNTDAHLRSVILGRSQAVPVVDGAMLLGEFGRIYFADFDQVRARERTVRVQVVGD